VDIHLLSGILPRTVCPRVVSSLVVQQEVTARKKCIRTSDGTRVSFCGIPIRLRPPCVSLIDNYGRPSSTRVNGVSVALSTMRPCIGPAKLLDVADWDGWPLDFPYNHEYLAKWNDCRFVGVSTIFSSSFLGDNMWISASCNLSIRLLIRPSAPCLLFSHCGITFSIHYI